MAVTVGMGDTLRTGVLQASLLNGTYNGPANLYLALYDDNGDEILVAEDPAYARQAITFEQNGTLFQNVSSISFVASQVTGSYTVRYFGVFDASTGGSPMFVGQLQTDRVVQNGNVIAWPAHGIQIS